MKKLISFFKTIISFFKTIGTEGTVLLFIGFCILAIIVIEIINLIKYI
jgi:hypothetical protein